MNIPIKFFSFQTTSRLYCIPRDYKLDVVASLHILIGGLEGLGLFNENKPHPSITRRA